MKPSSVVSLRCPASVDERGTMKDNQRSLLTDSPETLMCRTNSLAGLFCALLVGVPHAAAQSTSQTNPQSGSSTAPDQPSEPPRITTVVTVTAPAAPQRVEPSADVGTLPSSASVLTAAELQAAPYREPGEVL